MVVKRLIKQVARLVDDVLPGLREAYDGTKNVEMDDLVQLFISYCVYLSSNNSTIFVIFDAFDECVGDHYDDIIEIIRELNKSRIRIYITARNHLRPRLLSSLGGLNAQPIEIKASEEDVRNYLTQRLNQRLPRTSAARIPQIVEETMKGINGMYLLLHTTG